METKLVTQSFIKLYADSLEVKMYEPDQADFKRITRQVTQFKDVQRDNPNDGADPRYQNDEKRQPGVWEPRLCRRNAFSQVNGHA
jgi:hypothetical protein